MNDCSPRSSRNWNDLGQCEPVRKEIQKTSLLGKNSGEVVSNASNCPGIAPISATLIAKNRKLYHLMTTLFLLL